MRTTIQIDEDVLEAARSIAAAEKQSIGKVVSDLARRGLRPDLRHSRDKGFPTFRVSPDAAPITAEMVSRALEASD